jgi:hypothetical protein
VAAEVGLLRLYADWLADPAAGLAVALAAVPLDTADPTDAAPPAPPLVVDETRVAWAALGPIPDEVVQQYGRVVVLNVLGDATPAETTERATGDAIDVLVRVAALATRADGAGGVVDVDAVIPELYRTLAAVQRVLNARFAALGRDGLPGYDRAGVTLEYAPTYRRGQLSIDREAPNVLVGALVASQPVHFPWARAGL